MCEQNVARKNMKDFLTAINLNRETDRTDSLADTLKKKQTAPETAQIEKPDENISALYP